MLGPLAGLAGQLARGSVPADVVAWAAPVPFFGDVAHARVATVGINPSNLEFFDSAGAPLTGFHRRLETLESLQLSSWSEADGHTVRALARSCSRYFTVNPYRRWFDVLERVLAIGGLSYYRGATAAHLDLVPYATSVKWGLLPPGVRSSLIAGGRNTLAEVIAASTVDLLVLNGRSVVDAFISSTESLLTPVELEHLRLPRAKGPSIPGIRWQGTITHIAGRDLGREVRVLGFNHNLQSSFGVTKAVMANIGREVGLAVG